MNFRSGLSYSVEVQNSSRSSLYSDTLSAELVFLVVDKVVDNFSSFPFC